MLKQLIVENIAIVQHVDVEFAPGLNIITGETGAGKSLLVDALSLLRGDRAEASLVREGAEVARVTGVFATPQSDHLTRTLLAMGIDSGDDNEVILKRAFTKLGKSRYFINNTPVTAQGFKALGQELIDLSSQFENQKLLDISQHSRYLDAYSNCTEVFNSYLAAQKNIAATASKILVIKKELELQKREQSLFEFEMMQINEANISVKEWESLKHKSQIIKVTSAGQKLCDEIDNVLFRDQGMLNLAQSGKKLSEKLFKIMPPNNEKSQIHLTPQDWTNVLLQIEDLTIKLENTKSHLFIDLEDQNLIEERLSVYHKMFSRYGNSVEEILEYVDKCKNSVKDFSEKETELKNLIQTLNEGIKKAYGIALKLSQERKSKCTVLSQKITSEMHALSMKNAHFKVHLGPPAETFHLDDQVVAYVDDDGHKMLAQMGGQGLERTQFLFSANKGETLGPLEKIASGGELSRIMLAIKNVLFHDDTLSVFVFDEIDTGISGPVAAAVGQKLAEFCQTRQTLCITHLAQVACFADTHFIVYKEESEQRTVSHIKRADDCSRTQELAALISGEKVTTTSLNQAKALAQEAKQRKGHFS